MYAPSDLDILNDAQRDAVTHADGPTLVLAGAGSGKTRVLTHKIAYLVSLGVKPWSILAVTFTNKAAREMVERVEKLLDIPAQGLWIGTFHGICARILRREAEHWGFSRDFTIYDRDDQLAVMRKVIADLHIDRTGFTPARALGIVSSAKNNFLAPDEIDGLVGDHDAQFYRKLYERYNERLRAAEAFDFDDLLVRPVEKFNEHPETLAEWQRRFSYVLVDEYQDTNRTQYLLMKLLAGGHSNVTVVGDDDQSIYSWRGADIQNILGFERDFDGVRTVRLEQNYRSTGTILKAANAVVKNNRGRMAKTLFTDSGDGDPVRVIEAWSDRDEAARVLDALQAEQREHDLRLRDFAILYRTNAQSRSFEEVLRRRGILYNIVGGVKFYARKEIKDILAYLRIIANPGDEVSFERAVSTPKRGIGDRTVKKVEAFAAEHGITLPNALGRADEIVSGAPLKHLKAFAALLRTLSSMRSDCSLDQLVAAVIAETNYIAHLSGEHPENIEERLSNIDELKTALAEYENPGEGDDLSAFLAEVSLMTDVDVWDDSVDVLTLMTLHAAKGLEFPSVYIAGVEQGLFPLPQSFEETAKLEEERRLFYVGVTRACKRLHLSYAMTRMRYGTPSGGRSIFVGEIPEQLLDFDRVAPPQQWGTRGDGSASAGHDGRGMGDRTSRVVRGPMEFEDYPQTMPDYDGGDGPFPAGSWVRHQAFGRGQVLERSGEGENLKIKVQFGGSTKTIMVKYAKLTPV